MQNDTFRPYKKFTNWIIGEYKMFRIIKDIKKWRHMEIKDIMKKMEQIDLKNKKKKRF